LLLVVLGVGGAWGSRLTELQRFRALFVAVSIAFFAVAFRRLYAKSGQCAVGEACAVSSLRHRQRFIFRVVTPAALALMSFPVYAPLFY
jgi:mercuric ion transport protein